MLGRCEGSPALVGLKVARPPGPVRVTVTLRATATTAQWWDRVVPAGTGPRRPYDPRLVLLRSQGVTRSAILLARRPSEFVFTERITVSFDLAPEEISDDGLLVVELAEPVCPLPGWVTTRLAPYPAAGVAIRRIAVDLATGAPPVATGRQPVPLAAGCLLAIGPGTHAGPGPVWTLHAGSPATVAPDRVLAERGAPWPKPAPDAPPLRYRQKFLALARQRLADTGYAVGSGVRHAGVRSGRVLTGPVGRTIAPARLARQLSSGDIHAYVVPLDGGPIHHQPVHQAMVRRRGVATIEVTLDRPVDEPALLGIIDATATATATATGRRAPGLRWRLLPAGPAGARPSGEAG